MSLLPRTLPALAAAAAAVSLSAGAAAAPAAQKPAAKQPSSLTARQYAADRHWLKRIVQSDLAEIATGNLAQQKAGTPTVKQLGVMLVTDHTKHLAKARSLARTLKVSLPKRPNAMQLWMSATLAATDNAAFDQAWLTAQLAAHQTAISETRDEQTDGTHTRVRTFAQATLPTLQMHLEAAAKAAGVPTPVG